MSIKNLISNQIIIIDDHKRGTGEIKDFDNPKNDVHIDKETNYPIGGRRQKLKIRIPINSDKPIKIENRKKQIDIPGQLKREIKKAFEDRKTREGFIFDILKTLENFKSSLDSEEKVLSIISRLARHFDLNWDENIITKYSQDILLSYTQFFTDAKGNDFFIKVDKERITIGENSGYTKQFKKYNP